MSSVLANDAKKRAERQKAASKAAHTKIKPVVVKHVIKEQVMSIYDIKTHQVHQQHPNQQLSSHTGGHSIDALQHKMVKDSHRGSEQSGFSPRFYGQMPPYFGRPDEVSKDLVRQLEEGMKDFDNIRRAPKDPALEATAMAALNQLRAQTQGGQVSMNQMSYGGEGQINYETKSLRSDITYNPSAIGDLNMDELEQLKQTNEMKIKHIEEKYFNRKDEILNTREVIFQQQDQWETKERFIDSSLSYPTYGRGLMPQMQMNTFMIQDGMTGQQKKKKCADPLQQSPQQSVAAKQRNRILSPKRQRFENNFEKYMNDKFVDTVVDQQPPSPSEKHEFDRVSKVDNTKNAKVLERMNVELQEELKLKSKKVTRTLEQIEKEVQKLIHEEVIVQLGKEVIDNFKRVFNLSKEKGMEHLDEAPMEELLAEVADDVYFEPLMDLTIRESVDGEKETLDQLLYRVQNSHKDDMIKWLEWLSYFTKRGRLRDNEEFVMVQFKGVIGDDYNQAIRENEKMLEEEDEEAKYMRLNRDLKEKLVYKQNLVPKGGKGKYDVTVPLPFDFMKNQNKEKKSIRSRRVEEMIQKEKMIEVLHCKKQFRANSVPRSTTEPLYQKILMNDAARREHNKEASMAKTKASEKPFSFYERDKQRQREDNFDEGLPEEMGHQFRARIVPYEILVPKYQLMLDREYDRQQKIQRDAEKAFNQAKLPPRMQKHEDDRKAKLEEQMIYGTPADEVDQSKQEFSFQPPRARSVPDFRKLQKEFVTQLEMKKKEIKVTQPKPFNFHQPKPSANLRTHMDMENQVINPTMKPKRPMYKKGDANKDLNAPVPSTTAKHEAYVEKRRQQMEEKKSQNEKKYQEEIERFIKQNRLKQRVKCSPAIVSNAATLKKRRHESLKQAKHKMNVLERNYNDTKANIEMKVANRPLLVEQVTKAFIHNLNQIKKLQQYVALLRENGMDPDDYLDDQQKDLLISAEYYDRLNTATAYFPSQQMDGGMINQQQMAMVDQDAQGQAEAMDGEQQEDEDDGQGEGEEEQEEYDEAQQAQLNAYQQQQLAMLQQQQNMAQMQQQEAIQENQMEEDEDEDDDEGQEEQDNQGEQEVDDDGEFEVEVDENGNQIVRQHRNDDGQPDDEDGEEGDEDMYEGEGDEDEMVELSEEQIKQLLLQNQQQNMQQQYQQEGEEEGDMDDDEELEMDPEEYEEALRQMALQQQYQQQMQQQRAQSN